MSKTSEISSNATDDNLLAATKYDQPSSQISTFVTPANLWNPVNKNEQGTAPSLHRVRIPDGYNGQEDVQSYLMPHSLVTDAGFQSKSLCSAGGWVENKKCSSTDRSDNINTSTELVTPSRINKRRRKQTLTAQVQTHVKRLQVTKPGRSDDDTNREIKAALSCLTYTTKTHDTNFCSDESLVLMQQSKPSMSYDSFDTSNRKPTLHGNSIVMSEDPVSLQEVFGPANIIFNQSDATEANLCDSVVADETHLSYAAKKVADLTEVNTTPDSATNLWTWSNYSFSAGCYIDDAMNDEEMLFPRHSSETGGAGFNQLVDTLSVPPVAQTQNIADLGIEDVSTTITLDYPKVSDIEDDYSMDDDAVFQLAMLSVDSMIKESKEQPFFENELQLQSDGAESRDCQVFVSNLQYSSPGHACHEETSADREFETTAYQTSPFNQSWDDISRIEGLLSSPKKADYHISRKPVQSKHLSIPAFARPLFPALLKDRCSVIGISAKSYLRTCFRIGEAIRCSYQESIVLELFARSTFSTRELGTTKQHFQFADLFHDRPPFINGILANHKINMLQQTESSKLLGEQSTGQLVRCIGRLRGSMKHGWNLHILHIRSTDEEEIDRTKRLIEFSAKNNKEDQPILRSRI